MNSFKIPINQLLTQEEGGDLDFKVELNLTRTGKDELAKDACAFANARGGNIIVGVQDKPRKIVGIDKPLDRERLTQLISDRTDPPVEVDITSSEEGGGKHLGVIRVPEGKFLHMVKEGKAIYIRRGPITDRASLMEIQDLLKTRQHDPKSVAKRRKRINQSLIDEKPDIPNYEDESILIFPDKVVPYRKIAKKGSLLELAECPVFLPDFTVHIDAPEFGPTGMPLLVSYEYGDLSIHNFIKKAEDTERLMRSMSAYLSGPRKFYWSISSQGALAYGCGIGNLKRALLDDCRGAVCLAACGIHPGAFRPSTFILLLGGYRKASDAVFDSSIDLFLSSLPTKGDWVEALFHPFIHGAFPFNALSYEFAHTEMRVWEPKERRKRNHGIKGVIRRFRDYGASDLWIGGAIADTAWYSDAFYSYENRSMGNGARGERSFFPGLVYTQEPTEYSCPVKELEEVVISLTNPPPTYEQIKSGEVASFRLPVVRQFTVHGHAHTVHVIGLNGMPVEI